MAKSLVQSCPGKGYTHKRHLQLPQINESCFLFSAYGMISFSGQGDSCNSFEDRTQINKANRILLAIRLFSFTRSVCFPLSRSEEHTSELQSREKLVCRL